MVPNLRQRYTTLVCSTQRSQCNAVSSYWLQAARRPRYVKERNQKRKRKNESQRTKKTNRKTNTLRNIKRKGHSTTKNRVRIRNEEEKRQTAKHTAGSRSSLRGVSSIPRFSLLVGPVPYYSCLPSPSCTRQLCPTPGEDAPDKTKQAEQARHPPTPQDVFHIMTRK